MEKFLHQNCPKTFQSKNIKNTEKRLEMIFMTKHQNKCVYKKFVYKIHVKTRVSNQTWPKQ